MSVRRFRANQTSRHVRTRHVRHIFMPDDQTNQKLFISRKQYVKCNNSIPFRLQQKENSLDCCNNQSHSPSRPCVHPSTFHKVLIHKFCSCKCREIIIFALKLFLKMQTNQATYCLNFSIKYIFPFIRI